MTLETALIIIIAMRIAIIVHQDMSAYSPVMPSAVRMKLLFALTWLTT